MLLSVKSVAGTIARRYRHANLSKRRVATCATRSGNTLAASKSRPIQGADRLRSPAAMGAADIEQWAREFYPVFDRQGLIIDVRHNGGGNIDSWLLSKLLRKAWFYWQPRVGNPNWNMQYAFRGHIVVLCDQQTASDGEAFAEGFRRLGLGKVIGVRTWGGEIWLSANNALADNGIATAAETGVYGPEGKWLIEGHGVDPDIVVDNLAHATFAGRTRSSTRRMRYLAGRKSKRIRDRFPRRRRIRTSRSSTTNSQTPVTLGFRF